MRQIIFRAKRKDNGEWIEGDYIASDYISPWRNGELYVDKGYYDGMEWGEGSFYRIDPNTVGQYTGLTDKNGKRIFDGDILKIAKKMDSLGTYFFPPTEFPLSVVVRWDKCAWCWEVQGKEKYYIHFPDAWFHYESEVIGSIHDNIEFDAQNGEEKEE